jgi:hypothetical protein
MPRQLGGIETMNKTEHNFRLDVTIFVSLLITTITGLFLWLVIPHKMGFVFSGVSRTAWVAAHIFSGIAGLAAIVMHIILHWDWLKALRGRPLGGLPEKLRANRVVDRVMWFAFIATNVFGAAAWALHLGDDIYIVSIPDRLHVACGVMWAILAAVHLALHWKWIANTARRHAHINSLSIGGYSLPCSITEKNRAAVKAVFFQELKLQSDVVRERWFTASQDERCDEQVTFVDQP